MKRVYELFRALGMPEGVSLEAFGRIMGGHGAGAAIGGVGAGMSLGLSSAAEKGKGKKDERMRLRLNSRSRGRDQQQPQQQEGEGGGGWGEGEDWNTALTFLSTHLVGRQEARKARGVISRWVDLSFASFPCHALLISIPTH